MTRWLDNISLRTKVLGALVVVVIIGVLSLGWDAYSLIVIDAKTANVARESEELTQLEDMQVFLLKEGLDEKDLLLSGDAKFKAMHAADKSQTDDHMAASQAHATSPGDQKAFAELAALRTDYETGWKKVVDAFQQANANSAVQLSLNLTDVNSAAIHDRVEPLVEQGRQVITREFSEADQESKNAILQSGIGMLLFVVIGVVVFAAFNRTVGAIQMVARAAGAVEAEHYDQVDLSALLERGDDVGQLARVFKRMADEVYAREQKLKEQVETLNIQIDLVKQDEQVSAIISSDFFKDLKSRAQNIRKERHRSRGKTSPANTGK